MKNYLLLLCFLLAMPIASDAQNWRLIRSDRYAPDSTGKPLRLKWYSKYYYSNSRGSNFDNSVILFDKMEGFGVDHNGKHQLGYEIIQNYNTNNDLLSHEYLSVVYNPSQSKVPHFKMTYAYTANLQDSMIRYNYDSQLKKYKYSTAYVYQYDANGNMIVQYNYDTGWNKLQARYYSYDANNRVIKDSVVSYYNGNTYVLGVEVYKYYTSGNLRSKEWFISNGSALELKQRDHYSYNTKGLIAGDSLWQVNSMGDTTLFSVSTYTYNTQDLLVNEEQERYAFFNGNNVFQYAYVTTNSYTSFGYVKNTVQSVKDATQEERTDSMCYYYDPYFEVGAPAVKSKEGQLTAYPVPSSSFINLKWQADKPTHINARIVNLQGQVVKQWSDDVEAAYNKSIYVGELPAGKYYIILDTGTNTYKCNIVIAK